MGNIESEPLHQDFEVEISDLDGSELPADSSRSWLLWRKPRMSPHQRRQSLLLLNGVMLLAIALFLIATPSVRERIGSVFTRPTPDSTATIAPGVDLFYVQASPPWGRLLIDGKLIALPTISTEPPLRFARGQHHLVWQADPFQPQQCTSSVPPNITDTCSYRESTQISAGLSAWVITFRESLTNLAETPRIALLQAAQSALDARTSTDIVRPGEHYELAADNPACNQQNRQQYQCYATSSQPLIATLSFRLDVNEASQVNCLTDQPGNCTLNYQDCRLFCNGVFPAPSLTRAWNVFAPVLPLWTFATLDGRVLSRDLPDYAIDQASGEALTQFHITWDSQGWHITLSANLEGAEGPDDFNPVCAATAQQVWALNPPPDSNGEPLYIQWHFASGTLPAAGCLAIGTPGSPNDGLTTPTPSSTPPATFYYLHRFGVLLAVNKGAQGIGQWLPLADAYEQQLAQKLSEEYIQ